MQKCKTCGKLNPNWVKHCIDSNEVGAQCHGELEAYIELEVKDITKSKTDYEYQTEEPDSPYEDSLQELVVSVCILGVISIVCYLILSTYGN